MAAADIKGVAFRLKEESGQNLKEFMVFDQEPAFYPGRGLPSL